MRTAVPDAGRRLLAIYSGKKKRFQFFSGYHGPATLSPMPFGRWAESMRDSSTPEEDRIRYFPHKRFLTAEQKEHNHLVNSTRVRVEHSIGRLKRYARLADPYDAIPVHAT